MKILLISILIITTLAQGNVNLGSSGDQSAISSGSSVGDTSLLPSNAPPQMMSPPPQAGSAQGVQGVAALSIAPIQQPPSWNFLNENTLGGS